MTVVHTSRYTILTLSFIGIRREIETATETFDASHENPPVPKNQPPVAGSIAWSRSVFSRVRKTMTRLQNDASEQMHKEPLARTCVRAYTDLAKVRPCVFPKSGGTLFYLSAGDCCTYVAMYTTNTFFYSS